MILNVHLALACSEQILLVRYDVRVENMRWSDHGILWFDDGLDWVDLSLLLSHWASRALKFLTAIIWLRWDLDLFRLKYSIVLYKNVPFILLYLWLLLVEDIHNFSNLITWLW